MWVKQEWDYSFDLETKRALIEMINSIDRFVVIVDESKDEFIIIGAAEKKENQNQADVCVAALNKKGL